MNRLTSPRCNGIKVGYWSLAKKEELVQHLGAYEDIGLEPDEIKAALKKPDTQPTKGAPNETIQNTDPGED